MIDDQVCVTLAVKIGEKLDGALTFRELTVVYKTILEFFEMQDPHGRQKKPCSVSNANKI